MVFDSFLLGSREKRQDESGAGEIHQNEKIQQVMSHQQGETIWGCYPMRRRTAVLLSDDWLQVRNWKKDNVQGKMRALKALILPLFILRDAWRRVLSWIPSLQALNAKSSGHYKWLGADSIYRQVCGESVSVSCIVIVQEGQKGIAMLERVHSCMAGGPNTFSWAVSTAILAGVIADHLEPHDIWQLQQPSALAHYQIFIFIS